jgi:hypothetical protein
MLGIYKTRTQMFLYPHEVAGAIARFSDKSYLSSVFGMDEEVTLEQLVAILEAFWAIKDKGIVAVDEDCWEQFVYGLLRHELPDGSPIVIDWDKTEEKVREGYQEFSLGFKTWLIKKED